MFGSAGGKGAILDRNASSDEPTGRRVTINPIRITDIHVDHRRGHLIDSAGLMRGIDPSINKPLPVR